MWTSERHDGFLQYLFVTCSPCSSALPVPAGDRDLTASANSSSLCTTAPAATRGQSHAHLNQLEGSGPEHAALLGSDIHSEGAASCGGIVPVAALEVAGKPSRAGDVLTAADQVLYGLVVHAGAVSMASGQVLVQHPARSLATVTGHQACCLHELPCWPACPRSCGRCGSGCRLPVKQPGTDVQRSRCHLDSQVPRGVWAVSVPKRGWMVWLKAAEGYVQGHDIDVRLMPVPCWSKDKPRACADGQA